ncbi:MAG TPA: DNA polymerase III subunit alpha [Candidatus Paceibacterota bacterium]
MSKFVHLHNHSHYSLLDGLTKIDEMVERAKELGMESIALTDHGNLYGAIEFYKKAKKIGIKPILGVEAYLAPSSRFNKETQGVGTNGRLPYYHLILLAKNNTGWKNLIKLVSYAYFEGFYYKPRVDKELLKQYHEGLIALSACLNGEISRHLTADKYETAKQIALDYQNMFGRDNFYLEIGSHPNIKETIKAHDGLVKLSHDTGIPLVATQDIHYLKKEDASYHDILLAIQTGNKLSDGDRLSLKDDDFSMRSPEEMVELFTDTPEAILNTTRIAEACNVEIDFGQIHLPKFDVPENRNPSVYLKELVKERWPNRFKDMTPEIRERLDYELSVINTMGFADYFLIVQDFINWAKNYGIVVGPGRGSAAGSLVSYVLGITDIDPIKYDLLFERFLNPERIQMPDIDIDFTDKRRDEVLSYVKQKYGEDKVAQIITFGTMAARAAIRDAGRALGMTYGFCDKIAKLIPFNPIQGVKIGWLKHCLDTVDELKLIYKEDLEAKRLLNTALKLEGVARHASVHACGVVIAKEPLINLVPLQFSPQDNQAIITQFEMHAIEDLGLLKMDFLGLKNLTIIEETIRLIRELTGETLRISEIPLDDKKTFELLEQGETAAVFQFESSGMRRYMKEIRPTELEDLIALVSLYRPGPMDLIPSYIKRKHGEEKITYLHPKLEPILKNTYGVGVYQEQMMRIARDLAGYTLAEADTLRKAIGKKIRKLLDEQQEKLIKGMIENGIDKKVAEAIWELFPPFARYGFNRSHAACYALIGYQTAYLKAHYPVEYMTAVLNADQNDTDRIAFFVQEAKKININVLPPDVNKSLRDFVPDDANIRFGLLAVKNVGQNIVDAIVEERARGGPFQNFTDFLTRIDHKDLNKKSLESLIKCGAFDSLNIERNQALSNIEEILKFITNTRRIKLQSSNSLFGNIASSTVARLELLPTAPALNKDKLLWEKELMGLYISDHPLKQFEEKLKTISTKSVRDAVQIKNERLQFNVAGLISNIKRISTKTGQPMIFAKVEDMNDEMEIIVFSDAMARNPNIWRENNAVMVTGRMSVRNNEYKMICEKAMEL